MKQYKKVISATLCVVTAGSLVSFVPRERSGSVTVYEMYVNEEPVGIVKHAARGLQYYDNAMETLKASYPEDVEFLSDVYFKEVDAQTAAVTGEPKVEAAIGEAVGVETEACTIRINGDTVCHVRSREEADRIAAAVQEPYIQEIEAAGSGRLEEVKFAEEIRFDEEKVDYDRLTEEGEAVNLLRQSTADVTEYTVAEGDSLWDIASAHNLHINDIIALNPGLDPEHLKPGDAIALTAEKTLVSVLTKEKSSYREEIPFETEIREDSALLKGKTKTLQEGKNGTKEIQITVARENGRETGREIIGETVVEEPVSQIIAKGTKRPVATPAPAKKSSKSTGSSKSSASGSPVTVSRGSARGSDVVSLAKQYLGKPYSYGSGGPNSFDCSGFTSFVYRQFGVSIPRSSGSQGGVGSAVSKDNLSAGDIVLFTSPNSGGAVGHVGIYIGGGNFIHASSGSEHCVTISNLNSGNYARRYKGARRVF